MSPKNARDLDPRDVLAQLDQAMAGTADPDAVGRAVARLDALFAAHQGRIQSVCLRFVGDPEQAKELAQEAMLTAYDKLPEFNGQAKFGTWLYAIARNKCLNAITKRRDLLADDGVIDPTDPTHPVLVSLRRHEREELVRQAASAVLSPLEQEAVHMRYVEQVPQERITVLLGLDAASGARGLLQRCRRKLNREIRRRLVDLGHGSSFVRGTVSGL